MLEVRQRIRIRFRKEGDLRLISHRDLARVFERLFRRADLPLKMSEGFHPKAKLSFPSALSLGIRGADEVMEVELAEQLSTEELVERLAPLTPAGLTLTNVQRLEENEKKAQADRLTYEMPLPAERRAEVQDAIETLLAESSHPIHRDGREEPIDVRAGLEHLALVEDAVQFTLPTTRTAGVRPREVLAAIGLSDLEDEGYVMTRTAVEIAPTQKSNT